MAETNRAKGAGLAAPKATAAGANLTGTNMGLEGQTPGGRLDTVEWSEGETRPNEYHGNDGDYMGTAVMVSALDQLKRADRPGNEGGSGEGPDQAGEE